MTDLASQRVTLRFAGLTGLRLPLGMVAFVLLNCATMFLVARYACAQDYSLACDSNELYWLRHQDRLWSLDGAGKIVAGPIRACVDWRIVALDQRAFCWGDKGATLIGLDGQASSVEDLSRAKIAACAGSRSLWAAVGTLETGVIASGTHGGGKSAGFIATSVDQCKTWKLHQWDQGFPAAVDMAGDSAFVVLTTTGCIFDVTPKGTEICVVLRQEGVPRVDYGAWLSVHGDAIVCGGMSYAGVSQLAIVEKGVVAARTIDPGVGLGRGDGFVYVASDRLILLGGDDLVEIYVLPALEAACLNRRGDVVVLDARQRLGIFNANAASFGDWVDLQLKVQ